MNYMNIEVADEFGKLIAKADYRAAHVLLTKEAQQVYSPEDFKKSVEQMIDYWSGPIGDQVVNGQKTTLRLKGLWRLSSSH
jgi:hypothetical protein